MDKLFHPESVLIVGVSPSPRNMGRNIARNLIRWDFPGRMYLMGRKAGHLAGQPIHTSFDELPDGIDLAVFLTPAAAVPDMVDACGRKGIRWLAIESGGFSELDEGRRSLEAELLERADRWGIRFVGPNGLGAISRRDGLVLPFMDMPYLPGPGRVSLLAQSGGVGIVYLYALANEGVGLDKFVSMGNKLSLDECDYLDHIGSEKSSDVVCLYLEDVRRGRRLFESMRSFPGKVLVQKANVSEAGALAARSHTASLSTDDRLVDAAIRQAGALRVDDMATMVHFVMGLTLPPVAGQRLLVLSRSGGHAVIAADFAERYGFSLPPLPEAIGGLAAEAGRAHVIRAANPLDLGDVFDFDTYARMLEIAARGDDYDAIAVIHVFQASLEGKDSERLAAAARDLAAETGKPIYLCYLTETAELERLKSSVGYPLFRSPEILVESMAASCRHHTAGAAIRNDSWPPVQPMETSAIRSLLEDAARAAAGEEGERYWLPAAQVFELAKHAGLPVAPYEVARSADEAARAAARLGFPVAMKVLSADMLHKFREGGVSLNVRGEDAAREEYALLRRQFDEAAPGGRFDGILVQKMVKGFREVFVGGRQDPSFGPVVAVGFGGTLVEVLNDIAVRLCPVSHRDIREMLGEVNLFKAFRNLPNGRQTDFSYLQRCVAVVSQLLVAFPEIDELDLNPLKLFDAGEGGVFVDARLAIRC
jgi:acyl-CoA synthetase (NDP forming)